ncbi:MAG: helix-turn-helix domain-containing protein [Planctomycetes bacterium]|nr:helix-turn-helix domain-containing protein [Planctomycetota bacterium]
MNGYLTIEEVSKALGKSADDVKALVRAGKLREVRDAGKTLYKKDEVQALAAKEGSSVVDLEGASPEVISLDDNESFASALSNLADSSASLGALDDSTEADALPRVDPNERSGSASGISFADDSGTGLASLNIDEIPEELPAAGGKGDIKAEFSSEIDLLPSSDKGGSSIGPAAKGKQPAKPAPREFEDVPDLGLSGSSIISLEPGDSKIVDSPIAKEGTKVTKPGISVFDEEELGVPSDPMGETQISSGVEEFDSVGSGSGLLDLTQESDDTSLGAELLDVISPTEAGETEVEAEVIEDAPPRVAGAVRQFPPRFAKSARRPSRHRWRPARPRSVDRTIRRSG